MKNKIRVSSRKELIEQNRIPDKSMFKPDQPITTIKEDILGRGSFSVSFADSVMSYQDKNSVAIALYGDWGSGKSSILNMVLERIAAKNETLDLDKKFVVMKFDPWNFSDQNQLISQFFKQLSAILKRSDYAGNTKKVGELIEAYASFFEPFTSIPTPATIPLASFLRLLKLIGIRAKQYGELKANDLSLIKTQLNELLEKQHNKIIIVIDDIDRLNNTEIRQVFQLVKSLGDFPNTIYLMAFDKNVVINALGKVQEGSGFEYLEKVVQVPFEVPLISKTDLDKLLSSQLDILINDIPQEKWDANRWGNIYIDGLRHYFNTIRDVTRYINSLRFSLNMVKNEVNTIDFIAITAIQVFMPDIYQGIRDNKQIFPGVLESSFGTTETIKKQIQIRCDEIIDRASKDHREQVKSLLKLLFPKLEAIYGNSYYGTESLGTWRKDGRICSPDIFDIFFSLCIPKGEISNSEMEAILGTASNQNAFAAVLLNLNKDDRIFKFLERLEDYTRSYIPEEKIENVVTALMDIGDQFHEEDTGFFGFGTKMQILRINHQLTQRLDSQEKRSLLLKKAIEKAEKSLYTVIDEVSVRGQELGKYDSKPEKSVEQSTINASQLKELETLASSKIDVWAKDGRLNNHSELPSILYRWREWGEPVKVDSFVKDLITTDEGLVSFITSFLYTIKRQSLGSYTVTKEWHIHMKSVSSFVDLEQIEPRLRRIRSSSEFNQLSDRKKLGIQIFLDTLDGKIKDRFENADR